MTQFKKLDEEIYSPLMCLISTELYKLGFISRHDHNAGTVYTGVDYIYNPDDYKLNKIVFVLVFDQNKIIIHKEIDGIRQITYNVPFEYANPNNDPYAIAHIVAVIIVSLRQFKKINYAPTITLSTAFA